MARSSATSARPPSTPSARAATCTYMARPASDFAAIAMAFREHALRNPDAVMKKPMTLDDYLKARLIVEPFGLFDCSLNSDGAGAVVVTSVERARSLRQKPVLIKGFGTHNNSKGWLIDDHMVDHRRGAERRAGLPHGRARS